jgi:hypothetical protein
MRETRLSPLRSSVGSCYELAWSRTTSTSGSCWCDCLRRICRVSGMRRRRSLSRRDRRRVDRVPSRGGSGMRRAQHVGDGGRDHLDVMRSSLGAAFTGHPQAWRDSRSAGGSFRWLDVRGRADRRARRCHVPRLREGRPTRAADGGVLLPHAVHATALGGRDRLRLARACRPTAQHCEAKGQGEQLRDPNYARERRELLDHFGADSKQDQHCCTGRACHPRIRNRLVDLTTTSLDAVSRQPASRTMHSLPLRAKSRSWGATGYPLCAKGSAAVRLARLGTTLAPHSTSRTSSGGTGSSPAPSSSPRILATYAWVSGYGGTQLQAATAPGPAL